MEINYSPLFHHLKRVPLLTVLRGVRPEEVLDVAEAIIKSGITVLEVTLNSPNAFDSIEKLLAKYRDQDVLIGAGTVLSVQDVEQLSSMGTDFIVTPNTDCAVMQAAVNASLPAAIGCMTPTEALLATSYGVKALKIFPAARMGASYLKDIQAVLPQDTKIVATGGIGTNNIQEYLNAGAAAIGLGSNLYKAGKNITEVAEDAKKLVAIATSH